MSIPIWIDCDPGHDDAIAILIALFNPQFNLIGISTTYGNSSIENTTKNALTLLSTLHRDVPVYSGISKPLEKEVHYAPDIHGASGLDGTDKMIQSKLHSKININDTKSLNKEIFNSINKFPDLIIIAVGPLTNLYNFFDEYPQCKILINKISIMGGGFNGVYNKDSSEFNIWSDPKAANLILNDDILSSKIILAPLNVTHKVICNKSIQNKILNGKFGQTNLRKTFYELITFFADSYSKNQKFIDGPPVHDPVSIFVLLDLPNINLKFENWKLNCLENGKLEYKTDLINGSKVIFDLNVDLFWETFLTALEIADDYIQNL